MLAPASAADARDVVVTSFDGTKIYAHFFPATKPGAKAPTVLSGHGWGGTGSTAIDGGKGFGTGGNIDIGDLHRAGYNVVTWDARGFGRSGGEAHVDGPDFEARDVMALIDYVAKQPEARLDGPGDPRLGMSGSSYGGGIQLVTAGIDRRIDTIVPDIAWHSLTTSLFKDRSVKFGWGLLLGGGGLSALGNGIIPGVFSPVGLQLGSYWGRIISALAVGAVTGDIPDSDRDWFRSRGPGALVHGIRVPTLLTQGTVDTLFTLQESMENFKVLRGNGVPVKLMWHCGGHGICDFPTGERGHIERAAIRWFKRYLSEDEAIDTGARFEWVDDKGTWHGSGAFPLSRRQPLDLGGTRSGSLGLSPLELQGSPIEATQSSPSAHFNFGAPRAPAEVVGSPQLRLTYTGTALPAKTFVYAQVIDRANGQVVGNQVTPIPVVLDGKQHTISRPLEAIAAHAGPGSKLSLQIIGGTPLYGPQRALGGVRFDAVSATLPVGVPVTGRGGQAALRFGAIGRPRAAAVRRAGGVKRFRVCARDGQVRSISVVVRDRRGKLVARSKRFSTSGCARPAVRGWKRAARGRYTVVAAGRDVSNNRVRVTKAFRLR
jgi:ABC-2 type transport system ATP-binding protein